MGNLFFNPAFLNEQVVDAIGAGDSFNAGFIYKFINAHTPRNLPGIRKYDGGLLHYRFGGTGGVHCPGKYSSKR
jgi:hypothetical protein